MVGRLRSRRRPTTRWEYPMSKRLLRLVVACLALAGTVWFTAGCAAGNPPRAALALPTVDKFHPGTCRDAADSILALGRFAYAHDGAKRLTDADRSDLADRSKRLVPVRD